MDWPLEPMGGHASGVDAWISGPGRVGLRPPSFHAAAGDSVAADKAPVAFA